MSGERDTTVVDMLMTMAAASPFMQPTGYRLPQRRAIVPKKSRRSLIKAARKQRRQQS